MKNVEVWNILDLVKHYGEDKVAEVLSRFSCEMDRNGTPVPLSDDIERFIKKNAVAFAQKKLSVTYLVGDMDDGQILGFFTLTHKPVSFPAEGLSRTVQRTMERYAALNPATNAYLVSGFLIAQLGKNYAVENGNRISGATLLGLAERELMELQYRVGGGIEYLDCEANASLIRFYESQGFRLFGERVSDTDGRHYLQYMKFF